jgi:(1->4)-alpha-D-glucan 1-alpha-D-glucosylmutase
LRPLVATYRLQLNEDFDFEAARAVVPYLRHLGVSHLYLSPIWQARPGSTHGYDVVDPTVVAPALGGEGRFRALAASGLGLILDIVPNHMAAVEENPFWRDRTQRARFFDVDEEHGFRRRFIDVDDLVGVRVEDPAVFDTTHRKALELIASGVADGLRVDHLDGLAEPRRYLERLRRCGAEHVWVEKVLEPGEQPRDWPVEGTTGYDFLDDVTSLFVDPAGEPVLTELAGEERSFDEVAHEAKLEQAGTTFEPEVRRLLSSLEVDGLAEALAALPVYRTYLEAGNPAICEADRSALSVLPEPVRAVMMHQAPAPDEFISRFQQISAAVMAKGVENTALYRYVRLLALNEVGGDPGRFGLAVEDFHRANTLRNERSPRSLLAATTHDTKRSGDVRARLSYLSSIAERWAGAVRHWHDLTSTVRTGAAPDWDEELFIYQTLVGAWPIGTDRLQPYVQKAIREAKRNTNWAAPNTEWEEQVATFCGELLCHQGFLGSFGPIANQVALAGERISLAQLVLRTTAPGIPDIYWGDELWNFSLVDPDNRRPVDWALAQSISNGLRAGAPLTRASAKPFVTSAMLALRRRHPRTFSGTYRPLPSSTTTCAYQRGDDVVVAVALRDKPVDATLPAGRWYNVLEDLGQIYAEPGIVVLERR